MKETDEKIRLAIIDDHPLLLDGLCVTLSSRDEFDVVGQGADHDDAVRIARELRPDIMLIDISMPGGGLRATSIITKSCPTVKIIMLTASEDADDVMAAFRNGARGYASKGITSAKLSDIVMAVSHGQAYVPPGIAGKMLTAMNDHAVGSAVTVDPLSNLTWREGQVLRLLAKGLSNKEIGRKLDLQEKTIKHYVTNILQKLQVRNRVEAAVMINNMTSPA